MAAQAGVLLLLPYIVALLLGLVDTAAVHTNGSLVRSVDDLFARQATSDDVGATFNEGPPHSPFSSWVALGDSYSAGPGAGTPYPNDADKCMRRMGAYAPQLERSTLFRAGFSNPHLDFLSCTGHITTQVRDKQIPSIAKTLPLTQLLTLSIGGNDIGFSKILTGCVFNRYRNCSSAISSAREILYGGTFYKDYFDMMNNLLANLNWCPENGQRTRAYDCLTTIYQTAYPSFFESYTTQCNNVRFVRAFGRLLSQDLRASLNQLGQEMNTMIAYFIANVNRQQRTNRSPGQSLAAMMVFADQGERYAGHRFCREGVEEPQRNLPDTWFFNIFSNRDRVTVFDSPEPTGPASAYQAVDPNSCQATDDIGKQLACSFSELVTAGELPPDEQVPAYTAPESLTKSFHPTTLGFGGVSAELQQRLNYVSYKTAGRGCPTLSSLNLRIVGIGDSITYGTGSADNVGYFRGLNRHLGFMYYVPGFEQCIHNVYRFVGSQSSNNAFRHEGYPDQTISQIQSSVASSGTLSRRPNLILLMAGTVDISRGADPLTAA